MHHHIVLALNDDYLMDDLQAATPQLMSGQHTIEALSLLRRLEETRAARCRGEILPLLLAKLGVRHVQSKPGEGGNLN